jgi:8-amino-7-oxononanoate synthase
MNQRRQQLMTSLRQAHAVTKVAEPRLHAVARDAALARRADFTTHARFRQMQLGLAAADTLGVASPFFRRGDAVDGTRVLIGGEWKENFASYDYLSLNHSARVSDAARGAVTKWGVSATASRLVGGNFAYHDDLESAISAFIGTEAALCLVSGHATNQALIRTLTGPGDLVLVDALAHNSIYEGIRSAQVAHLTFPHNDWSWVDAKLDQVRDAYDRVLIVIEGLYSMDGDAPDLARFVETKARHDCWLMVDEAHSIGVLGATGRGICEEQGVAPSQVDILMGTLSKSFCSAGGYIAGSQPLIDIMRFNAPGFVFSVGLSAPNAAAALAAVTGAMMEPGRTARLRHLGRTFLQKAKAAGLDCGASQGFAVAPILIGDSLQATWISNALLAAGFNVLPIIAPAVPDKSARLRFFLNADHGDAAIDAVIAETARLVEAARRVRF